MFFTLALLLSGAGRDIAVVDVGGGARVPAVREAVLQLEPGATLLSEDEARVLLVDYGTSCKLEDGLCWARAAAASEVTLLVLVPADNKPLVFVDASGVPNVVDGRGIDMVVERGLFPARFGRLRIAQGPAGAVVVVDALPLAADGVARVGPHRVRIEAPGHEPRELEVAVAAGADTSVDGALVVVRDAPPPPPSSPDLRWIWPAGSAAVAVAALGTTLALDAHLSGQQALALDGGDVDVTAYRSAETLEVVSIVVTSVALLSAVVGAVVVTVVDVAPAAVPVPVTD